VSEEPIHDRCGQDDASAIARVQKTSAALEPGESAPVDRVVGHGHGVLIGVEHPPEPVAGWAVDLEALEVGELECRASSLSSAQAAW
jgi:hypothetical protein